MRGSTKATAGGIVTLGRRNSSITNHDSRILDCPSDSIEHSFRGGRHGKTISFEEPSSAQYLQGLTRAEVICGNFVWQLCAELTCFLGGGGASG